MDTPKTLQEKINRGAQDAGDYFRAMAGFIGFSQVDAEAILETRYIIEQHIPEIVAQFYENLLRHPPTRRFFLKADGSLDTDYIKFRMLHLTNFWRRTAGGVFDDDYARYIDYIGRAHTRRGADPNIDIAEQYVIGQVGFIQHAISQVLSTELTDLDPQWEKRAQRAWRLLLMVILQLLTRVYHEDETLENHAGPVLVDFHAVQALADETYERGLDVDLSQEQVDFLVGPAEDIPDGSRKLVMAEGRSIGVFHHRGGWYALRNFCQHAGGPVAEGKLEGDELVCPVHGYRYYLTNGALVNDPNARLTMYPVEVREGQVYLSLPPAKLFQIASPITGEPAKISTGGPASSLPKNEFHPSQVPPGKAKLVFVDGVSVAVYNVDGVFYAAADECPHTFGPLHKGELRGTTIICPRHGSCFDLTSGAVKCGPADEGIKTYRIVVEGDVGKVLD